MNLDHGNLLFDFGAVLMVHRGYPGIFDSPVLHKVAFRQPRACRPGCCDGLLMVGRRPRGNWGCAASMAPIDPVADYEKHARKVSSDALRGRIWGLRVADDQRWPVTGCGCEAAVGDGLWGIGGENLVVWLDSVCPDATHYDIYIGVKVWIFSNLHLDDMFYS